MIAMIESYPQKLWTVLWITITNFNQVFDLYDFSPNAQA